MRQLMIEQDPMQLINEARAGDRVAFDKLIGVCRKKLESFIRPRIRHQLRDRLQLHELMQDTFVRAFESIGRFHGRDLDAFFGWLVGIAKNVVLKAVEQLQGNQSLETVTEVPASRGVAPSKHMRRNERFDRLQRAIEGLSDDYKEAVLLCRIEGLPIKEVAKRMNRSPDAVKKLLWRSLKQLRKTIGSTASLHLPHRTLDPEGGRDAK